MLRTQHFQVVCQPQSLEQYFASNSSCAWCSSIFITVINYLYILWVTIRREVVEWQHRGEIPCQALSGLRCVTGHNAWRNSVDAPGSFQQWHEAVVIAAAACDHATMPQPPLNRDPDGLAYIWYKHLFNMPLLRSLSFPSFQFLPLVWASLQVSLLLIAVFVDWQRWQVPNCLRIGVPNNALRDVQYVFWLFSWRPKWHWQAFWPL